MSKSLFLLAQVLVLSRPEIHTINIIRIFQIILQTEHIISYRTNQILYRFHNPWNMES